MTEIGANGAQEKVKSHSICLATDNPSLIPGTTKYNLKTHTTTNPKKQREKDQHGKSNLSIAK